MPVSLSVFAFTLSAAPESVSHWWQAILQIAANVARIINHFCKFHEIANFACVLDADLPEPQRMGLCHPGILAPLDPPHPIFPPTAPRQAQAGLPSASAQA